MALRSTCFALVLLQIPVAQYCCKIICPFKVSKGKTKVIFFMPEDSRHAQVIRSTSTGDEDMKNIINSSRNCLNKFPEKQDIMDESCLSSECRVLLGLEEVSYSRDNRSSWCKLDKSFILKVWRCSTTPAARLLLVSLMLPCRNASTICTVCELYSWKQYNAWNHAVPSQGLQLIFTGSETWPHRLTTTWLLVPEGLV